MIGHVAFRATGAGAPAIVFVHGLGCDGDDWRAQVEALSPRYLCVTLDLPGHGASAPSPPDLTHLGRAVNRVLRECCDGPAVLVGHSLGAKVIREAHALDPAGVCAMVFVDCAFHDGDPTVLIERAAHAIDHAGFGEWLKRQFGGMMTDESSPELRSRILARAARLEPAFLRALYLEAVAWDPKRSRDTLRGLDVPALVLQSSYTGPDLRRRPLLPGMTTPFMDLVAELVPHAELRVIPGVGHFTMMEDAEGVNAALLGFLSRLQLALPQS